MAMGQVEVEVTRLPPRTVFQLMTQVTHMMMKMVSDLLTDSMDHLIPTRAIPITHISTSETRISTPVTVKQGVEE